MRAPTTVLLVPLALAVAGCALQSPPAPADIQAQSIPNVKQPARWSTPGAVDGPVQDAWLARASPARARRWLAEQGLGDQFE